MTDKQRKAIAEIGVYSVLWAIALGALLGWGVQHHLLMVELPASIGLGVCAFGFVVFLLLLFTTDD